MFTERITAANLYTPLTQYKLRKATLINLADAKDGISLGTLWNGSSMGGDANVPAGLVIREEIFINGADQREIVAARNAVLLAKKVPEAATV
jgi:hypothetical protein